MKTYVQRGLSLDCVAPSGGVTSGKGVLIGTMFGVAAVTALVGESFALHLEGVYILDKATSQAWTVGAALYWDDTAKKVTTTSGGNTKIGVATAIAGSADTTGYVRLNGAF